MMQEYEEFKSIAEEVTAKLNSNTEWIERFAGYAKGINENLNKIKDKKKQFREWAPLHLYISVGSAKDSVKFSLRYLGQDVANLTVNGQEVLLTTEDYAIKNKRNFGYEASSGEIMPWRSREAASFREYFRRLPPRKKYGKDNDEHRIESMILSELSKNIGTDKSPQLHAIRPVKIAEICRFQMPTPFSASTGEPKYLANGHGHIDILARVGKGSSTKLCIMEVKDEYSKKEPPDKVLKQGLIYAAFIRALLRSKSGNEWWKIFGFSKSIPNQLVLYVTSVMPFNKAGESDKSFANKQVTLEHDVFKFHHIYFEEENNKITNVKTSLGKTS